MAITPKGKAKVAAKKAVSTAAGRTVTAGYSIAGKSSNPAGAAGKKFNETQRKLGDATTAAKAAGVGKIGVKMAMAKGEKTARKVIAAKTTKPAK